MGSLGPISGRGSAPSPPPAAPVAGNTAVDAGRLAIDFDALVEQQPM